MVSFTARTSEVLAVVCPNGMGKSTLLRIVSGRVRNRGFDPKSIILNDNIVTSQEQLRKISGFVARRHPFSTPYSKRDAHVQYQVQTEGDERSRQRRSSRGPNARTRAHPRRGCFCWGRREPWDFWRGVDVIHDPPILLLDEPTSEQSSCSWLWKIIYRTKQLFLARTMQALVGGFGLGSVYVKVRKDEGGVGERLGLLAFSLSFLLSSTVEALPIYLQERRVLMKEASRGSYRVSSYLIANTIIFFPLLFVVAILFSVPLY